MLMHAHDYQESSRTILRVFRVIPNTDITRCSKNVINNL